MTKPELGDIFFSFRNPNNEKLLIEGWHGEWVIFRWMENDPESEIVLAFPYKLAEPFEEVSDWEVYCEADNGDNLIAYFNHMEWWHLHDIPEIMGNMAHAVEPCNAMVNEVLRGMEETMCQSN